MGNPSCLACGAVATEWHHVVPRSLLPNDGVVPLCARCHGLVHGTNRTHVGTLTRAGLARRKAANQFIGAVHYGSRLAFDGVTLEADAGEQATIARARDLHAAGLSLRKVATALEAEGRKARNGKAFYATQIARMVGTAEGTASP
jgi:hypothetical protein